MQESHSELQMHTEGVCEEEREVAFSTLPLPCPGVGKEGAVMYPGRRAL